ncbi:LamB/YcsF family protein [Amycolatopsis alkalitolerans]|uniref:LamB/YcsF family protein n=1 Tax=Amycolatopsis alkalitolerans TaxID=2547244 RepID=A0A5C4LZI1_9PSEU|nr:5-oxoprolinase subunit PxpA [Amycolatopsis alkalitolerans]TNC25332.1 LamB/YcsF family protein [Amycolatopsis alkalitolerans]
MTWRVNINSDMGEGFGRWQLGPDEDLIPLVPTVNIACGFHAGDPRIMHRVTKAAIAAGADVGAHVALPDLRGFGRRPLEIAAEDLLDDILYQIGALDAFVRAEGGTMRHVKPHGSLYAMCGRREEYARALLEAVSRYDRSLLVIVGQGWPERLAGEYGLTVRHEGYVDLDYQPDGFPVVEPMKQPRDAEDVARRAIRLVTEHAATAVDGSSLRVDTPTLCLHGDMPGVVDVAVTLRKRLAEHDIEVVDLATAVAG